VEAPKDEYLTGCKVELAISGDVVYPVLVDEDPLQPGEKKAYSVRRIPFRTTRTYQFPSRQELADYQTALSAWEQQKKDWEGAKKAWEESRGEREGRAQMDYWAAHAYDEQLKRKITWSGWFCWGMAALLVGAAWLVGKWKKDWQGAAAR
jgi:hypothetical protein